MGGLKISQEKNTVSQVQYEKKECIFFYIRACKPIAVEKFKTCNCS